LRHAHRAILTSSLPTSRGNRIAVFCSRKSRSMDGCVDDQNYNYGP
jgi:hypothetical protein